MAIDKTPSATSSTVQQVVGYIEQKIRTQALRAGDRIPTESELCSLLGVSRTSVREAIKILEAMTLIQVRRGDGTYISYPNSITFSTPWKFKMVLEGTTWREVLEFREQMEFSLLRCAMSHATGQDLQRIKQNLAQTQQVCQYEPGNAKALKELDEQFHALLAQATKNQMLADMYTFTFDLVSPLIMRDSPDEQAAESTLIVHGLIVEALEKNDLFLAAYAARQGAAFWAKLVQKQDGDLFLL